MRQYLLLLDGINILSFLGPIPPINDIYTSIVLHEPESKFNVSPPRYITSSIADTLLPTNDSPLIVVSTPLLLIFDKCNIRKRHVKQSMKKIKAYSLIHLTYLHNHLLFFPLPLPLQIL